MKKLLVAIVAALVLGPLAFPGIAQKGTKDAMRKKLDYAQGVLEGLTLQEFNLAVTNAVLLRDMSHTNVFSMLKNSDYVASSTNFTHAVDGLIKAAKSQDLERATEAYTRVVQSCVQCHEQFRREQFLKAQEKAATK
jgi:Cytochrome C'